MQHGGKRPGAGRPAVEVKKKTFTVVCYPNQIEEIRKFAKSLNNDISTIQAKQT